MAVHSSLTYHLITYTLERLGRKAEVQLLKGLSTPKDVLMSLNDSIEDVELRKLGENFRSLFGQEEFYYLGKDLVDYFYKNRDSYDDRYPFGTIISRIPSRSELTENDARVLLGYFSQINNSLLMKLIAFKEDYVEFQITKNMEVYKVTGVTFHFSDADFITCACNNHRGAFEQALRLMRIKNPVVKELFHQGDRDSSGKEYPYCFYRIFLKENAITKISEIDDKKTSLLQIVTKHGLKDFHLRTLLKYADGLTYTEIAELEGRTEDAIKSRMNRNRDAFGGKDAREMVTRLKENGFLKLIKEIFETKTGPNNESSTPQT